MKPKLVTIITVVYNAVKTLERTIQSVISQDNCLFEYYIIDGGSTDGSIEIIKRYEEFLAGWITEEDKGIYDAMNKGINLSKGKWIYFLGADDTLAENILSKVADSLTDELSIVFGKVKFDNGHEMVSEFGRRILFQNTVHHQSAFYNMNNFLDFRYDITLRAISDYELNLKIYTNQKKAKYFPVIIANCDTGGASAELDVSLDETNFIRKKFVLNKFLNASLSNLLKIYYFQKKIRLIVYGHRV